MGFVDLDTENLGLTLTYWLKNADIEMASIVSAHIRALHL